jgi:hypothetical protein
MKIQKIELLFIRVLLKVGLAILSYLQSFKTMKPLTYRNLRTVAESPKMIRAYLIGIQRDHDALAENHAIPEQVRRKHTKSIMDLIREIEIHRKMVVRMIQVQHAQINKYWKSIHDARKTVRRGTPASLEAMTTEIMIQMALRVIVDLKDAIPSLIEPLVTRINGNLRKLQQRMLLFKQVLTMPVSEQNATI